MTFKIVLKVSILERASWRYWMKMKSAFEKWYLWSLVGGRKVYIVFEVSISNVHLTWMLGMEMRRIVKYVRIIGGGPVQSRVKNEEPSERDS